MSHLHPEPSTNLGSSILEEDSEFGYPLNDFEANLKQMDQVDYAEQYQRIRGDNRTQPLLSASEKIYSLTQTVSLTTVIRYLRALLGRINERDADYRSEFRSFQASYSGLDESLRHIVMRELFDREDFFTLLKKTRNHFLLKSIFNQTLTAHNVITILINSNSSFNVDAFFEKVTISCRLLPPKKQRELYFNLLALYQHACAIAATHEQIISSLDSFTEKLLSFDLLTISYSRSAKTVQEHFMTFTETIWDQFPLLVRKDGDKEFYRRWFDTVWTNVKQPLRDGEGWEKIVSRVVKRSQWVNRDSQSLLLEFANDIYLDSESQEIKDISLFMIAFFCLDAEEEETSAGIYRERILEAFKDGTERGLQTQHLLAAILSDLSDWDGDNNLDFARQIEKHSLVQEKSVLLGAYLNTHNYFKCPDFYSDLIKGLHENGKLWIKAVNFSESRSFRIEEIHILYRPLRSILEKKTGFTQIGKEEYYWTANYAFADLLWNYF
jgi:hypothetical protein